MASNPKASLKHLSFVMLVLQNTALGIVSKYSRLVAGPKYNPATAVLLVELFKFLICLAIVFKVSAHSAWRIAWQCEADAVIMDR